MSLIFHISIQIEVNSNFVNEKRMLVSFLPNDPAAVSFLQVCIYSVFTVVVLEFNLFLVRYFLMSPMKIVAVVYLLHTHCYCKNFLITTVIPLLS